MQNYNNSRVLQQNRFLKNTVHIALQVTLMFNMLNDSLF